MCNEQHCKYLPSSSNILTRVGLLQRSVVPHGRSCWVQHIDLVLGDSIVRAVDWESTSSAWAGFAHLKTLTICYHPKDPAPLNPYIAIGEHLPESLQLLRLRPWGEADVCELYIQKSLFD